jgi:osmotically-inducible protein OsmY
LQNDEQLRTYAIDVKVTDGTTILSGNVSDEDLKVRAGKLAGTVHGVKRVINNVEVRP